MVKKKKKKPESYFLKVNGRQLQNKEGAVSRSNVTASSRKKRANERGPVFCRRELKLAFDRQTEDEEDTHHYKNEGMMR